MIDRHWDGIAAYCKPENKVALGFVEGFNNKIRVRIDQHNLASSDGVCEVHVGHGSEGLAANYKLGGGFLLHLDTIAQGPPSATATSRMPR